MAQKRMFTMKIVDSDAFLDMPLSAQCLYFHLNMRADDDGFIGNAKRIMRVIGCNDDDLKLLIAKRFVLAFEDGIIVIKHWRMHNCLTRTRYCETQYIEEKNQLFIKKNMAYSKSHGVPLNDKNMAVVLENGDQDLSPDYFQDAEDQDVPEDRGPGGVEGWALGGRRNQYPAEFEAFWEEYPKKVDKGQAHKKYLARVNEGYVPGDLLLAARNYRMACERERTPARYVKHAKTFLGEAVPFLDYLPKKEDVLVEGDKPDFEEYL